MRYRIVQIVWDLLCCFKCCVQIFCGRSGGVQILQGLSYCFIGGLWQCYSTCDLYWLCWLPFCFICYIVVRKFQGILKPFSRIRIQMIYVSDRRILALLQKLRAGVKELMHSHLFGRTKCSHLCFFQRTKSPFVLVGVGGILGLSFFRFRGLEISLVKAYFFAIF